MCRESNTRIRAGRTVTSQWSPCQLKLRGNGTVGTDDCDHERHEGATKNTLSRISQHTNIRLTTMEIYVNSIISYVTSRYMCMYVMDFYLNKQMDRDKYIMIQFSMIPQEFVEKNNLAE